MRIVIIGVFLGSALGMLAGAVASAFVVQKPHIERSYRDQVITLNGPRVWEL